MTAFLDTHGFDAFIAALATMSGAPRAEVLRLQAGAVLDICIQRSPGPRTLNAGLRRKVELRVRKGGRYIGDSGSVVDMPENRVPRPIPDSTLQTLTGTRGGRAGDEWYTGRNLRGKRLILHASKMLGNEKFHRRQGLRDNLYAIETPKVTRAIDSIGGMKMSWVQIGQHIGAPLRKVPAYLRKTMARPHDDGAQSRVTINETQQFIDLVNTNPLLIARYGGAAILQGAIDTRLKAFERDIRNDVFADITARAQRYPGIFTA